MKDGFYNEESLVNLNEAEEALFRISLLLDQISQRQEKVVSEMGNSVRSVSSDVEKLNSKMERDTGKALASMVTGTKSATSAMRSVWSSFLNFFLTTIIQQMSGAIGGLAGGGGAFGALLGGVLSLIGLEKGGVVKGSRVGTPVVVGENFTDELVIPLSKLNLGGFANSVGGGSNGTSSAQSSEPLQVNLYPQFVIENNSPLDSDISLYEMTRSGKAALESTNLAVISDDKY